jgi:hypothetical protein
VASDNVVDKPAHTLSVPVTGAGEPFTVTGNVTKETHPPVPVTEYVILAVPIATPDTTPVDETEAIPEALLAHTPPGVASVSVIVVPVQIVEEPEMAATTGTALTVTKTDFAEPIDAIVVGEQLHTPPPVASLKVVVLPAQTLATPVIAAGNGFTVTTVVLVQPTAT